MTRPINPHPRWKNLDVREVEMLLAEFFRQEMASVYGGWVSWHRKVCEINYRFRPKGKR